MKIYDYSQYELRKLSLKDDAEPLIETDKNIEVGDCISLFGDLYEICISGKEYVVVKSLGIVDLEEEPDTEYTDDLTCPYCHKEIEDSFELPDEDDDYECPYCGSHFSFTRQIEVSYISEPISKGEVIVI